jgi:hypothetical protein
MLQAKHLSWALMLAIGWVAQPSGARAQDLTQPTADGYALYDRVAGVVIAKSGLPAPEGADGDQLGCQRYGMAAQAIIRFALSATLEPGLSLDNPRDRPRVEARRDAADQIVDDAQAMLDQLANSGGTTAQCGAIARSFGARAFSLALAINRTNVQRNAQALVAASAAAKPPSLPEPSPEELAAEEAAKAESDRLAAEKADAEHRATDKLERAFANLGSVTPAPPNGRAQPLSFNIYLLDTPATRAAKDFRLCFEPALYQRAAKPIVDLASAALEVPAAAPVVDEAVTAFFDQLRTTLAARFAFPADRLVVEAGDAGAVRGPVADSVKAAAAGCHVYLAPKTPLLAYNDSATTIDLLAENVIEDVVLHPALVARLAALPKLATVVALEVAPVADTDPATPQAVAAPRAEIANCIQSPRCQAGAKVAINACVLTAERRLGKAAIERELAARQQATAELNKRPHDEQPANDIDLIASDIELINEQLQQSLADLQQNAIRLRQAARAQILSQELDAVITAGRNEGEQSMGTPLLQCYSRLADGRAAGLTVAD